MKSNTLRMHCIEVTVNPDLTISYRLSLPVKADHAHLFSNDKIQTYIRDNKIRYRYVFESTDREMVLTQMYAAQVTINGQKVKELKLRHENLLANLATLTNQ